MRFVVVSDRPGGMTGRAYLKAMHAGMPWTTPFEDEAAKMPLCMARRALAAVSRCFGGYGVEAVGPSVE